MTYTYCSPAIRNSVLCVSADRTLRSGSEALDPAPCTRVRRSTHLPKNRQTQFLAISTGARGKSATPIVRNAGKKELTATSKAYANSTRLSDVEAWDEAETKRRLVMMYRTREMRREASRKSPRRLDYCAHVNGSPGSGDSRNIILSMMKIAPPNDLRYTIDQAIPAANMISSAQHKLAQSMYLLSIPISEVA